MRQRRKFLGSRRPKLDCTRALVSVQRSVNRSFVRLPGWMTVSSDTRRMTEHVAFVRDVSLRGMFFFGDFDLRQGERISLTLEYLRGSNRVRLHLSGTVVRVEKPTKDATAGIALCFDSPLNELPRKA